LGVKCTDSPDKVILPLKISILGVSKAWFFPLNLFFSFFWVGALGECF